MKTERTIYKMEKTAKEKRGIIKNIAIIFLAVMLVLTLFSNTILNYSLPEVSVQYTSSGTLTTKIRGSGTVKANSTYSVTAEDTREIIELYVSRGSFVEAGTVIALLADGDSDELLNAEKNLSTLRLAYKKAQLENEQVLENAQAEINSKQKAIDALKDPTAAVSGTLAELRKTALLAKSEMLRLKAVADEYTTKLETADRTVQYSDRSELYSMFTSAESAYTAAKTALAGIESSIKKLEETIAGYDTQITENQKLIDYWQKVYDDTLIGAAPAAVTYEQVTAAYREITQKQNELTRLYNSRATKSAEVSGLQTTMEAKETAKDNALAAYNAASAADKEARLGEYNVALAEYNTAKSDYDSAAAQYAQMTADAQDMETELANLRSDYNMMAATYNDYTSYTEDIEYLKSKIEEYEKNKTELEKKKSTAAAEKSELGEKLTAAKEKAASAKLEYEKYDLLYNEESYIDILVNYEMLYEAANNAYEAAQSRADAASSTGSTGGASIEKLTKELEILKSNYELTVETQQLDNKNSLSAITAAEKTVETVKAKTINPTVKAKAAGTVTSLPYVVGEKVTAGSTIAEIEIKEKGYQISMTVTAEQAARIKIGDTATVLYYWYGTAPVMTVSAITNDASSKGKNKIIYFSVTGDSLYDGQSLEYSLGGSSTYYSTLVPTSAIREDNKGKFVLVVTSKSTPLGNRYSAVRYDVQVLASDDTKTAISSTMYGSEYIITASTKPISDGTQVRLAETK